MQNIFLNNKWQSKHLKGLEIKAGARYTPKLNVELPITRIFDGLTRNVAFYVLSKKHRGNLLRAIKHITPKIIAPNFANEFQLLNDHLKMLDRELSKIRDYNTRKISWNRIQIHSSKASDLTLEIIRSMRFLRDHDDKMKKDQSTDDRLTPPSDLYGTEIHYLYKTEQELRFFKDYSQTPDAQSSNKPRIFLRGSAGMGKTHLLCDLVKVKMQNGEPAIMFFAREDLFGREDLWKQMISRLSIKSITSKGQFLRLLNDAGRKRQSKALLVIDAINESPHRNWKKDIQSIVDSITPYKHIALVVSVRNGFENEVIYKYSLKDFVEVEHRGFQFREWEAVTIFFHEFKLPLPEIPLLMPEFQNPLFLLLFCKAFQNRIKTNKGIKQKQIFRGHEGATYIFETFVDSVSKRISKQFKIGKGAGRNIWDAVIEKIAAEMVRQNDDRISEDRVIEIAKNAYPSIDYHHFIKELDRNLLLVKSPRYSMEKKEYEVFDFRFPFQKFSDHLIGRYLFKKYEGEFGKTNKNLETAKKFFSKRRKLGKFLSKSWNRGIIEALSIQCPEHLNGSEFVDVAPYLKNSHIAQEAFVESLIWRKPEAFTADLKNTVAYINEEIIMTEWMHNSLLNAFLAVAPIPSHPFNANFLHKHLSKFSLAKRDSWWSTFLHYQYGERGAVDRIADWGWSEQDKTHIGDESLLLVSTALTWFLTASNRFLRDKSTKAIVSLLSDRLAVVLSLLEKFKNVNDPYILERLYAIAYGCVLRNSKDEKGLKNLALFIYNNIFKLSSPPNHILLRDYARGIIEVALKRKIAIRIALSKIRPPYGSQFPKRIPSSKTLRKKYYPDSYSSLNDEQKQIFTLWSSMMYNHGGFPADFGNYVINSKLNHWSNRKLNDKTKTRKEILESFLSGLNRKQLTLWKKRDQFYGVSRAIIYRLIDSNDEDSTQFTEEDIKESDRKEKRRKKIAEKNFVESLSKTKREKYQREIKPYLINSTSVRDPKTVFDYGLAQRWIFNRVLQLGWSPELHGKFDRNINYHRTDRSEHKPERIGKKYQWIALHEFLSYVADNFAFKRDNFYDPKEVYNGPWQILARDIDPSCTLKQFPNEQPEDFPKMKSNKKFKIPSWDRRLKDHTWLKRTSNLPNAKKLISLTDENQIDWVMLEGFLKWEEETPPEEEKYQVPFREMWYMYKSYLVKDRDFKNTYEWAKRQDYMGDWMPKSYEFYNVFIGEYPWAGSFLDIYTPYYSHDIWTRNSGDASRRVPDPILVTDDQYLSSGSSLDCSTDEAISISLPAKWIIDKMKLKQTYLDGRYFDSSGKLVAIDPVVYSSDSIGCLLFRKESMLSFLKKNKLRIFWTALGEKQIIGGPFSEREWLGSLRLSGACTLNPNGRITGNIKAKFKSS